MQKKGLIKRGACQNTICEQSRARFGQNMNQKRKKLITGSDGEVRAKRIIAVFRDKCRILWLFENRENIKTRSGPKIPAAGHLEGVIFETYGLIWFILVHREEKTHCEKNLQIFSGKLKLVVRRLHCTPDFFKQILRGCFGLQTASEAKSDLRI